MNKFFIDILNCLLFVKNGYHINIMFFISTKYTRLFMLKYNIIDFNKIDIILFIKYIKLNFELNRIQKIIKEHHNPYYPYYDELTNMIDNIYRYYLTIDEIINNIYSKYNINCSKCYQSIYEYDNEYHPNYMNPTIHYCRKCKISTKYDKGLYIIKYSNIICELCGEYVAYSIKKTTDKIPPHCKCSYQTAMYI